MSIVLNDLLAAAKLTDPVTRKVLADPLRDDDRDDEAELLLGEGKVVFIDGRVCAIRTWTVRIRSEQEGIEDLEADATVEAANLEGAAKAAGELTRRWLVELAHGLEDEAANYVPDPDGGVVGSGGLIRGWWGLVGDDADEFQDPPLLAEGSVTAKYPPNHRALARAAGGNPDCEHDWDNEGMGYWKRTLAHQARCLLCGLQRWEWPIERPRHSDEHESAGFKQPDSWCRTCRSDESPCGCEAEEEEE